MKTEESEPPSSSAPLFRSEAEAEPALGGGAAHPRLHPQGRACVPSTPPPGAGLCTLYSTPGVGLRALDSTPGAGLCAFDSTPSWSSSKDLPEQPSFSRDLLGPGPSRRLMVLFLCKETAWTPALGPRQRFMTPGDPNLLRTR